MNFLDALKSGKRFRRKGSKNWNDNKLFCDFMAGDWEVEEKTVTINASRVEFACHDAAASTQLGVGPIEFDIFVDALKKELGL